MVSFRRKMLLHISRLFDGVIFALSLLAASWVDVALQSHRTVESFLAARFSALNVAFVLGLMVLWSQIFERYGLYESRRFERPAREWLDITKATTAGTAMLALAGLVFRISAFAPRFILALWAGTTLATLAFRMSVRFLLRQVRRRGRNLRFVLVAGTNARAWEFADMLEKQAELGYRVVGCIDDNVHVRRDSMALLGRLADFPRIVRETIVDEVVIALPIKSHYDQIQAIVRVAEEQGVTIRYLPKLFDTRIASSTVERFERFDLMTIASGPESHVQYPIKRLFDVVFAILALAAALPAMAFAALGIALTSPGPIFFVQERMGYNKRKFRLYKFRTMVVNAESLQASLEQRNEMDGPVFKIRRDPRITWFGALLRRTSIDELPQLFNVLKGEMSLVGPRPLPLRDCRGFAEDWQRRRFSVLPGITCIWQISGRNNITFEKWMELDMSYIDNWSLWGDISILAKTLPAVLKKRGAS